ncbi:MAG: hypothetical protein GVY19_12205 [Bacteroidetes bacterium]|jgi:hypothetical protein|nr:hypothetical protein [Bacteroidota bacterium]
MKHHIVLPLILTALLMQTSLTGSCLYAQNSSGTKISVGFGGGANLSQSILLENQFQVIETLDETVSSVTYDPFIQNLGFQYFFHGEADFNNWILSLQPGTYKYAYGKEISYITDGEEQTVYYPVDLTYFIVPVEFRKKFFSDKYQPYIGARAEWGLRIAQEGAAEHLNNKFTVGASAGLYINFTRFILNPSFAYSLGLHNLSRVAERNNSGTEVAFTADNLTLNHLYFSLSVLFPIQVESPIKGLKCNYHQNQ